MATSIADIFIGLGIGKQLEDFYFQSLCTGKYRYVMIVPRKCMTEYKCLCKEHRDWEFDEDVYYMTPQSYIQYKTQILDEIRCNREFSILIIDDIMMYGRGINRVLKNMVEDLSDDMKQQMINHINISVFIESNKDFLIDKKFGSIMEERSNCYIPYRKFENVLKASDLFLESFYAKLVPNTAFVNAWYYKDWRKGYEVAEKLEQKIKVQGNESLFSYMIANKPEQDKYNFESIVYYEKQEAWMQELAEFYCVRYYRNGEQYSPFLIPYVFLKPMTGAQIDDLMRKLKDTLEIPQLWEGQSDEFYILKYEYLTNLISACYGIIFMERHAEALNASSISWDNVYEEDNIVSKFTFGRKNVLSMEKLYENLGNAPSEKMRSICKGFSSSYIKVFDEKSGSGSLFREAVEKAGLIDSYKRRSKSSLYASILNNFLKLSNLEDERLAAEGKERYDGLSTIKIRAILEEKKKLNFQEIVELYGEMVRCMDTGMAAISIKRIESSEEVYYGAVMNSGEQAYRELQEKNAVAIHYMAQIEQDCRNLYMSNRTESKIDEFWEKVEGIKDNITIPVCDIREVRDTIKKRHGQYSELDVERSVSSSKDRLFNDVCREAYRQIKY